MNNQQPTVNFIDSHVHFWNYDANNPEFDWIGDGMEVIKKSFLPDDFSSGKGNSSEFVVRSSGKGNSSEFVVRSSGKGNSLEKNNSSEFGVRSSEKGFSSEFVVRSSEKGNSLENLVRSSEKKNSSEFGVRSSEKKNSQPRTPNYEPRTPNYELRTPNYELRTPIYELPTTNYGIIAVQAAETWQETEFLLDLASKHDFIKGVVGWADLGFSSEKGNSSEFGVRSSEKGNSSEFRVRSSEKGNSSEFVVRSSEKGFSSEKNNSEPRTTNSQLLTTNSQLLTPNSQLRTPNYELPTPNSELLTTNSQLPTTNSQLRTPNHELPTTNSQLRTPNHELPTTNSQLQTPNYELLKGFRHIIQAKPNGFMSDDKFRYFISKLKNQNYTYDLLLKPHQLEEALELVQEFPNQKFVIDHLAKPDIRNQDFSEWKNDMQAFKHLPNVFCKVSGMVTEAHWQSWKESDFRQVLDTVFNTFGTDRLIYGSDWPVCLLAADYQQVLGIVSNYISDLSINEQEKIMAKNAIKFYNI